MDRGPSRQAISILEEIEDQKAILEAKCEEINKEKEAHMKAMAKFQKKKEKHDKYLGKRSSDMGSLFNQEGACGKES